MSRTGFPVVMAFPKSRCSRLPKSRRLRKSATQLVPSMGTHLHHPDLVFRQPVQLLYQQVDLFIQRLDTLLQRSGHLEQYRRLRLPER